jgi:tetratricopeptide (TPR) repeat protein
MLDEGDESARCFAARCIGLQRLGELAEELSSRASVERSALVRRFIYWALGRLRYQRAAMVLREAACRDGDVLCRRAAMGALREIDARAHADVMLGLLRDEENQVKISAAEALAASGDSSVCQQLVRLLESPDVYVRRAAARALLFLGDKRGFPALIDSLEYRSLDNSGYNYGREIPNLLARFTGREPRREVQYWRRWWRKEGGTLRLERIAQMMRQYRKVENAVRRRDFDEAMGLFEGLCQRFGKLAVRLKGEFAGYLLMFAGNYAGRYRPDDELAVELAEEALALREDASSLYRAGVIFSRCGRRRRAIEVLQRALELKPEDERLRRLLEKMRQGS